MYPEILRELSAQRGAEMRDRAHRILFARRASKILRARRRGLGEADEFPVPAIPDYADGSFAAGPEDTGFIPTALKSRCGVLVAVESPSDGDLFGVRLPRNAGPGPLGRGLLVRPGTIAPIQLATDD
jgi:hypothetical protein